MPSRIAVLFGAGASKGAGNCQPTPPPLGGELFAALCDEFPSSWGSLSTASVLAFEHDFETAVLELWEQQLPGNSRLIIEMAIYFSGFLPASDGSDLYAELLKTLIVRKLLQRTAFATLNYECILDHAIYQLGLKAAHFEPEPPKGNVLVWKPHGSCNLLPQVSIKNSTFIGVENFYGLYEGPVAAVHPSKVREEYDSGSSLPPAISLYAPGKPTPVAQSFVETTREFWANWVDSADLIITIGTRPTLADTHIWDPILKSDSPIWYVGGNEDPDYRNLASAVGERLSTLATRFKPGLQEIKRRLPIGS